jgi:hypothetical protein
MPARDYKLCEKCGGAGWYHAPREGTEEDYLPDIVEKYCDCPYGERAKETD